MITNANGSILIDGVTLNTNTVHKSETNGIMHGDFYIVSNDGELVEPLVIGVYDTPTAYALTSISFMSDCKYRLTGTCVPVGSTIFITLKSKANTVSEMKNNIIASVISDDEGVFSIEEFEDGESGVVLWTEISVEDAETAYITCTAELIETPPSDDTGDEVVIQQAVVLTPYVRR